MKYFKITFFPLTASVTVGVIFYGLFGISLDDTKALSMLFIKGIVVGLSVGLILGLLNAYFKIDIFKSRK
jgi:ABC-type uncharacterized transport system permease subunit